MDDFQNLFSLLAPGKVIGQVEPQLGNNHGATLAADLRTAIGAFIFPGIRIAGADTGFRLKPPVVRKPPRPAGEHAHAVKISLETMVPHALIQPKGELNRAHIVVCIDEICSDKQFVIDARRPETKLRGNEQMAPLLCNRLVPVPDKPAGPGLDSGVESNGKMLIHRNFQPDIGCGRSSIGKVGTDGHGFVTGHGILRHCRRGSGRNNR